MKSHLNNTGGSPMTMYNVPGSTVINGAGVLIVEMYNDIPCYTLFRNKRGEYEEVGGSRELNEDVHVTAARECREETANLLKIYPNELMDFVVVNQYIAFVTYVIGLHRTDYLYNLGIVNRSCGRHWNEMVDMTRIPIQNIILGQLPYVVTYDGQQIQLRGRTCNVIQEASKIIVHVLGNQPRPLYRQITQTSRNTCLLGTITYTTNINPIIQTNANTNQLMNNVIISNQLINNDVLSGLVGKKIALYAAPDLQFTKYKKIRECNSEFGGLHVTLVGFSSSHQINMLKNLNIKQKHWAPDIHSSTISGNKIIIHSKTLDHLAEQLTNFKFKKIKGMKSYNSEWHVTANCENMKEILKILVVSSWSIYAIIKKTNKYKWVHLLDL